MDFSEWLSPDDVMEKLLVGVFGPAATVVALFALANFVWSWFGFARSGVRVVGGSVAVASAAYRRVMRMRPAAVAVAVVVTVLLVLVQLVWLWSASRIANGLSYLWNAPFGNGRPDLTGLTSYVRWDWISTGYMVASVVALLASYISTFRPGARDTTGRNTMILALPLMVPWGLFCVLGSVLALILAGMRTISHESPKLTEDGITFLVVTLIVVSYTIAVSVALSATGTIARYWRPPAPARLP